MIIVFGNQKGGVGKTTLCTLFANYIAAMGKKTLVIDCDNQQTITEKRKADEKKYPDARFLYNVQAFNITSEENVFNLMQQLKAMNGVILIDAPGNLTQQGLMHIFSQADYVICPFQYETTSVNSTATFIMFLERLKQRIPSMKTKIFFVVNRHDKRYGKKQELILWANTDKRLSVYGMVTPRIEIKADMQRYNTIEVMSNQRDIVTPSFKFICDRIFNNEGYEDQTGNDRG